MSKRALTMPVAQHQDYNKNRDIEMKSKEKPLTQIGAYLAYVTICVNGFDTAIRSIVRF